MEGLDFGALTDVAIGGRAPLDSQKWARFTVNFVILTPNLKKF